MAQAGGPDGANADAALAAIAAALAGIDQNLYPSRTVGSGEGFMMPPASRQPVKLRRHVYEILEEGAAGDRASIRRRPFLMLLIVVNLVAVALELMPELGRPDRLWFIAIEIVSLVVLPWSVCGSGAGRARALPAALAATGALEICDSAAGLVDLLAVLPFWLGVFIPGELRVLQVLRMVRFLKIARYSPALRSLLDVLYAERRTLFGCVVILLGLALIAASLMHLAEGRVQPDKLGTIPDAMWWAIVTLGTIGYGDVVPVTVMGKLIASVTIFFGRS